jgi:hypothetical protein
MLLALGKWLFYFLLLWLVVLKNGLLRLLHLLLIVYHLWVLKWISILHLRHHHWILTLESSRRIHARMKLLGIVIGLHKLV